MSTKLSSNGAGPMIKLENILVPTDFSDCSKEATAYACELANRFDARVQLLHVLEPLQIEPDLGLAKAINRLHGITDDKQCPAIAALPTFG